jgi:hypothetical protein
MTSLKIVVIPDRFVWRATVRNYRIVRIAGVHYSTAEKNLYGDNPQTAYMPYTHQQQALFDLVCMYSDGFSRAMRALGHDAHEIVYDLETMQKTWARENNVQFNDHTWRTDIIQDIHSLPYELRKELKTMFGFIKLVVVFTGAPAKIRQVDDIDIMFVGIPSMVEPYETKGGRAHVLYHGFDEDILNRIGNGSEAEQRYDFTFAGSSGFGIHPCHTIRYWFLVKLMERTNLQAWIDEQLRVREQIKTLLIKIMGADDANKLSTQMLGLTIKPKTEDELERSLKEFLSRQREAQGNMRKREGLPIRTLQEQFPQRCHPPKFGLEMYDAIHRSRLSFNIHSTKAGESVGNMRMFETTGVGGCLLTDTADNMAELFEDGKEVVTYFCLDECVEKVRFLLDHEDQRRSIAQAGQKRTLRDHTIRNRCQQIDAVIQPLL